MVGVKLHTNTHINTDNSTNITYQKYNMYRGTAIAEPKCNIYRVTKSSYADVINSRYAAVLLFTRKPK